MKKSILLTILFSLIASVIYTAEFEVIDTLTVNGNTGLGTASTSSRLAILGSFEATTETDAAPYRHYHDVYTYSNSSSSVYMPVIA